MIFYDQSLFHRSTCTKAQVTLLSMQLFMQNSRVMFLHWIWSYWKCFQFSTSKLERKKLTVKLVSSLLIVRQT